MCVRFVGFIRNNKLIQLLKKLLINQSDCTYLSESTFPFSNLTRFVQLIRLLPFDVVLLSQVDLEVVSMLLSMEILV